VEIEEAAPGHGGGAAGMSWGLTGLGTSTAEREVEEAGGRDDGFDGSRSRGSWWARVDRGLVVGSSGLGLWCFLVFLWVFSLGFFSAGVIDVGAGRHHLYI
jgi:hypothetical protein